MSSQNEAHFQGFPELTDDAPPTPDAYVDAPTTTRRDKDTRMVSLYLSFRDGSCMPILGSCVSLGGLPWWLDYRLDFILLGTAPSL